MSVYPRNFSDKRSRLELLETTNGHCWYCGCVLEREMIAEHQSATVLVPSCRSCNNEKGSKPLEIYRAYVTLKRAGIPRFNAEQYLWLEEQGFKFPDLASWVFYGETLQ